jgi:hypothetical protein
MNQSAMERPARGMPERAGIPRRKHHTIGMISLIVFGLQIASARSLVVCVLEEDWHFRALLAWQTLDDRSSLIAHPCSGFVRLTKTITCRLH